MAKGIIPALSTPTMPSSSKVKSTKVVADTQTKTSSSSTTTTSAKDTKAKTTKVAAASPAQANQSSSTTAQAKAKPEITMDSKDSTRTSKTASSARSSSTTTVSIASTKVQSSRGAGRVAKTATISGGRLARLTAYWAGEGDYYTGKCQSSTGIRLHDGHCAVDPKIIPYGSVVEIAGLGSYLAVDTGSAVISREAARETGHTAEERNALVIDLFFESRQDGQHFAASGPKYASISWRTPRTAENATKESRGLMAEENWKEHNKSL